MNVSAQLRELSEPRERGEKIVTIIERTARLAGLSYSRAFEIYYGRARRIEPAEIARISEALKQKQSRDARHELAELRLQLNRLESVLVLSDQEFHRTTIDIARAQLRQTR